MIRWVSRSTLKSVLMFALTFPAAGTVGLAAETSGGAARSGSAASPVALLVRGAERVKGLPGFPPNAFEAIYGEYRLEADGSAVQAWATREALYYDLDTWVSLRVGNYAAETRRAATEDRILVATDLGAYGWTVITAFPLEGMDANEIARFLDLFLDRFVRFLAGAKLPTDVSFPATLGGS
jgi:hypothetical protein